MEAWVRFDTVPGPGGFVGIMTKGRESGTNWIGIDRVGTGVASSIWQLPDGDVNGTTVLGTGTWYYVVATFNTSPQRRRIYVNGVQEGADNTNSAFTTALNTRLGDDSNGNWMDGQMDEVRFSLGVTRSAGWILTSYNNQNNPATFFTLGAESSIAAVTSCGQTLVKSGVYVGNNTVGRPVFVGFQPDVLFVKRDAASYMVVRTSTMPAIARSRSTRQGSPSSQTASSPSPPRASRWATTCGQRVPAIPTTGSRSGPPRERSRSGPTTATTPTTPPSPAWASSPTT